MRLGELIDRSVNFWRAHWKPLFQLMIGFQLLQFTLFTGAQAVGNRFFPLIKDPSAVQSKPLEALLDILGMTTLLGLASVCVMLVSQIGSVAVTHYAYSRLTKGSQPTIGDAFRHAAARLWTIVATFALSMGWALVVTVLSLIPSAGLTTVAFLLERANNRAGAVGLGVVAALSVGVALLVVGLWLVIRFILLAQIIAVEPLSSLATFRRANALSSGRVEPGVGGLVKMRLTVLITILGTILFIVSIVASMPLLLVGAAFGANLNPGTTVNDLVPALILTPLQLVQTVLTALVAPLYVVFQTFFYLDMRMRREGLDLQLALEATRP